MLKLTQLIKGYDPATVYVSARHVVAVYPANKSDIGCYVELSTNDEDENGVLHVSEDAEAVASHEFLNAY